MNITVYLGATEGDDPAFSQAARQVGAWIGAHGHDLVYGGSDCGLMGVLARSVIAAGGRVTGVEPAMFVDDPAVPQIEGPITRHEPGAELPPYGSEGTRLLVTRGMPERMTLMVELGQAFLALPGGPGTLEEISELISMAKLRLARGPVALLNVDGYWDPLREQLACMNAHGFFPSEGFHRVQFIDRVDELDQVI